jgi:hypothetical protein
VTLVQLAIPHAVGRRFVTLRSTKRSTPLDALVADQRGVGFVYTMRLCGTQRLKDGSGRVIVERAGSTALAQGAYPATVKLRVAKVHARHCVTIGVATGEVNCASCLTATFGDVVAQRRTRWTTGAIHELARERARDIRVEATCLIASAPSHGALTRTFRLTIGDVVIVDDVASVRADHVVDVPNTTPVKIAERGVDKSSPAGVFAKSHARERHA